MIIFNSVKWKNFLSTGNNFIEISLDSNRSTILVGKSGSGKSTLLDAISFALFNKPFRNITKNQLVNSINQKDCLVELKFTIGSRTYLIRRGVKPNIFEIYLNDVLISQDSHNKDYQQFLEKSILKFNFKTFSQIVVLGASNFTPFMQLKPVDRRVIIESLLDIEIFSVMNSVIRQRISNVKSEILNVEKEIVYEEGKKSLHEQYIQDLTKLKSDKISENNDLIDSNAKQMSTISEENIKLKEQLNSLSESINFKSDVLKNIDKITKITYKLNDGISKSKNDIAFYKKNNLCSTCKQQITEDTKHNEICSAEAKISELSTALTDANSKIDKLNLKLKKAYDVEVDITKLQNQISKNENSIFAIEQFCLKIKKENDRLLSAKDDHEKYSLGMKEIEEKIKELVNRKQNLLYNKTLYEGASTLLKDDGVKAKIIKQYLPLINKHTNAFLNSMNFFVSFNIDEEFNETIKSRGRDDFSYENFSEGEKQRIDLALLLTWRTIAKLKNSINTNLLIMDEVLDSYLDNAATENVLNLLNSDSFKNVNIFVISHKETISDKFDSVVTFAKIKNFSAMT